MTPGMRMPASGSTEMTSRARSRACISASPGDVLQLLGGGVGECETSAARQGHQATGCLSAEAPSTRNRPSPRPDPFARLLVLPTHFSLSCLNVDLGRRGDIGLPTMPERASARLIRRHPRWRAARLSAGWWSRSSAWSGAGLSHRDAGRAAMVGILVGVSGCPRTYVWCWPDSATPYGRRVDSECGGRWSGPAGAGGGGAVPDGDDRPHAFEDRAGGAYRADPGAGRPSCGKRAWATTSPWRRRDDSGGSPPGTEWWRWRRSSQSCGRRPP